MKNTEKQNKYESVSRSGRKTARTEHNEHWFEERSTRPYHKTGK